MAHHSGARAPRHDFAPTGSLTSALGLFLALALGLAGCGGDSGETASSHPARTYTIRGQIVTLPAALDGEIRLAHEAVDDFVSAGGEVVGMDAMTMSFPLAEGIDKDDLAVGDIIEFDLEVDWTADVLATVRRITKLPPGTELVFAKAEPPSNPT